MAADLGALIPPAWACADDESLDLILSLLREDASVFSSTSKGKQAAGTLSDADLAIQLYAEELSRAATYASDRRMTKSIQGAVQADANALLESERVETVARNDRQFAIASSNGRPQVPTQEPVNAGPSAHDLEMFDKLSAIYVDGIDETDNGGDGHGNDIETMSVVQPESSSWAASRKPKKTQRRPCVACRNVKHFIDLARAPCMHEYCRECLASLFQHAISDESLFPPRCCRQTIPVDANRLFLSSDLVQQFKKKSIEWSTSNRTYCHRSSCSTFIPLWMIQNGVARCPKCQIQTCITCKGPMHGGDCPSDTELQMVLQIARKERWQRCQKCFTMVELNHGCFHITCKCGAQFCYLCGAKWKTCRCDHWEEHRLYERAEQIYNRDHNVVQANAAQAILTEHAPVRFPPVEFHPVELIPVEDDSEEDVLVEDVPVEDVPDEDIPVENSFGAMIPQPSDPQADRAFQLERIMEHLRQNHQCDHERWAKRHGPEECEECGDRMRVFIYECRQCRLMACRRCRFNRL
ncbi:hypothetical protein GGR51DRAFT_546919 [Nemania sp. FL0031]|nr:hypothetical protein GGR51DRAFT_546919 [Nemania sp. FL0031]